MGQQSAQMIRHVLGRHYKNVGITNVSNHHDLTKLAATAPGLIFLGMKNIPVTTSPGHHKIWLSQYFDERGLNYTGSNRGAIALDYDKPASKQAVRQAGLMTSSHFLAQSGQYTLAAQLPLSFPLFIKPPNTGGGKGIDSASVVRDFPAYESKVEAINRRFDCPALVENYLQGREFSVAIMSSTNDDELVAMPIELITEPNLAGDRILGQSVKAADTERVVAVTDLAVKALVVGLAKAAFNVLGARDYGRIDIRLDADGTPHFLEANLVPGLAQHDFTSYFTAACQINRAMDYETMILSIVELGLARQSSADVDLLDISFDHLNLVPAFS